MRNKVIKKLLENQDLDYVTFHQRTCPNTGPMIGVRVPIQRRIAKEICQQDFRKFLNECQNEFYEETLIEGLVIATAKIPLLERLGLTKNFVPKIKNWAICDTFCNSFKFNLVEQNVVWDFLQAFRQQESEFAVRFFLIMALTHFLKPEFIPEISAAILEKHPDLYYINMAKAWLIAEMMVDFKQITIELLKRKSLPESIQNKAIQKIRESYRIAKTDKDLVRNFKI